MGDILPSGLPVGSLPSGAHLSWWRVPRGGRPTLELMLMRALPTAGARAPQLGVVLGGGGGGVGPPGIGAAETECVAIGRVILYALHISAWDPSAVHISTLDPSLLDPPFGAAAACWKWRQTTRLLQLVERGA